MFHYIGVDIFKIMAFTSVAKPVYALRNTHALVTIIYIIIKSYVDWQNKYCHKENASYCVPLIHEFWG